ILWFRGVVGSYTSLIHKWVVLFLFYFIFIFSFSRCSSVYLRFYLSIKCFLV
ncbi:hypothetical protein C7212DRAFT_309060, partial [Tuber magnatum]